MNIVLVGYRCSGKTSVGRIIANKTDRDFWDTDVMIEDAAGCSIEEIISRGGWEHFRDIEKRIIEEVSARNNLVLATGGGVVMDQGNVKNLKRNGFVVWLKGDTEVLEKRMGKEISAGRIRPSLTGEDPKDEIKRVLDVRNPLYNQAGDFIIDTSRISVQEVADKIIKELSGHKEIKNL